MIVDADADPTSNRATFPGPTEFKSRNCSWLLPEKLSHLLVCTSIKSSHASVFEAMVVRFMVVEILLDEVLMVSISSPVLAYGLY